LADNRLLIRSVSAGLALLLVMAGIVGCFTGYTRGYSALSSLKSVLTALMVLALFITFWVR
jgi:hypothetical protein